MAGVFRFSNAVSDIDKIISTYKSIYSEFITWTENDKYFNHADAAIFLAQNGLATSLGAIGVEALKRSTRDDKSRDPLYNQHKSYSEMFRMLGWYEPGSMQTNFKLSEYGSYINDTEDCLTIKKLLCLNVLHIVSPNPLTNVKGNNILRPFVFILKLMAKCNNMISRDEIIYGVLACENDTSNNVLEKTISRIISNRKKGKQSTNDEIQNLKKRQNIKSDETLPNYTRFPIAVMKWTGWAETKSIKLKKDERATNMLILTESGINLANMLLTTPDIRYEYLENYQEEEKIAFIALSNLQKLKSVGFDLSDYSEIVEKLMSLSQNILNDYHIENDNYLFFGYQEASREDLIYVDNLLETLQ